jgi:hypothetical protein
MTYLFSNASNATIINEVEVKNDAGNALPVIGVTGSPLTVAFGGPTIDAFGRLRISSPHTIFDNSFSVDDKPRIWGTVTANSGTAVFVSNISAIDMGVSTALGSKSVRTTKQYFQYQPGKSLLSMNTFVMNEGKANLRQRVGYYDNSNGIFLEREGNTAYIVKRSSVSGTPVDTRVQQNTWSNDTLLGNGSSGKTLNLDKAQIFFTDVEWLGVGSVRTGFVIDGQLIITHQFNHANIESNVYMTTATLPVRYEIENTGITTSSSNLKQICSTVISEAGYSPTTITRSASTDLAGLSMNQTVYRPLLSIRLKSNHIDKVVLPTRMDLFGLQSTPFAYKVIADANITGGSWQTIGTDSVVEYNSSATTLNTGGHDLLQGMFIGGTSAQPVAVNLKEHDHSLQLRANATGTPEVFTIAVKATTNNDDALGSITWEEQN